MTWQPNRATGFGLEVRRIRESYGWSRQDLSNASGVSVSTIARTELNGMLVSVPVLWALAEALEADVAKLMALACSGV